MKYSMDVYFIDKSTQKAALIPSHTFKSNDRNELEILARQQLGNDFRKYYKVKFNI